MAKKGSRTPPISNNKNEITLICYATTNRQMALRSIADECDLVLVVGDRQSSNSNRLVEVALNRGIPAHLINGANEIDAKWVIGVDTIGLTAGASTPESIVKQCIERLMDLGVSDVADVEFTKEDVIFAPPKEVLVEACAEV